MQTAFSSGTLCLSAMLHIATSKQESFLISFAYKVKENAVGPTKAINTDFYNSISIPKKCRVLSSV
jgi:hypothetical protein